MHIKSHQLPSRNKRLRRSLTVLWFLDFATVYSYFNVQMCFHFIVVNKIFCFFKKWVFVFLDEGTFQGGGVKFSKILRGFAHIGEGSDRFRFFLGRGGLCKKGWGQYFRVGLIPWRTLQIVDVWYYAIFAAI